MTDPSSRAGLAMLGMYDMPYVQAANDALWNALRSHLGRGPERLDRTSDFWDIWQAPDLIVAQTCGYPYRARLHGQVTLLGTPDYQLDGCPPGYYRSALVTRDASGIETLAQCEGASYAFNEALSQSGWAGPMLTLLRAETTPGALVETGAHADSLNAVAIGAADVTGVDLLTYSLLQASGSLPKGLRIFAMTDPTPVLPFICATGEDERAIRAALHSAIDETMGSPLGLRALIQLPAESYLSITSPPSPAELNLPLRQLHFASASRGD